MDLIHDKERMIREYLLGGISDEELDQIEEALFKDDGFYDEVRAVEDRLVEQYVRGRLSSEDRARFESRLLLTDTQRRQVTFARDLKRYLDQNPNLNRRPKPWYYFSDINRRTARIALGAILLLIATSVFWLIPTWHLGEVATISVTLHAGQVRSSGDLQRVKVGRDVRIVQISLVLREPIKSEYRAKVLDYDRGNVIFSADAIAPQLSPLPPRATIDVPAERLAAGDYELRLTGRIEPGGAFEAVDSYYFRLLRD
jgi:hypothetical protein